MTTLCPTCAASQFYPELVQAVAHATRTTADQIAKQGRTPKEAVRAREVIAYVLQAAGLGQVLAGRLMGLDPSTVFHLLRRIEHDPATLALAGDFVDRFARTTVSA